MIRTCWLAPTSALTAPLAASAGVIYTLDADFFDDKVIAFAATKDIRIMTDVELLRALPKQF